MRIGILGHVGNENLGDESIIAAVIQNVRRRRPDADILGFTLQPLDTEERHGIPTYPIRRGARTRQSGKSPDTASTGPEQPRNPSIFQRMKELVKQIPFLSALARSVLVALETVPEIAKEIRFLLSSRQHIHGLDLLIFAGSHQLNDFVGGAWAYPYTVLKWTLLAKETGAEVVFLSLGAGPIDGWLGRTFIRQALKRASYRSYRDVTAQRMVDSLHLFETDLVVPDLAFSLDSSVVSREPARSRRTVVGINPLPLYTDYWFTTDFEKYDLYVGKLAAFADWLVNRGCEVRFIPTQLKVDPAVIDDVRIRMATNGRPECEGLILEPTISCLDDLLSALGDLDIMIATRYHGVVLSLAFQKPVLAIAYHDKSRDLMNWFGQGDFVIEGDTFSAEALTELILRLEKEAGSITSSLRQQLPDFRSAVQAQYDEVFRLIDSDPRSG